MRIQWSQHSYLSVAWMVHLLSWQHRTSVVQPGASYNTPELLHQAGTQLGSGDLAGAVATVQFDGRSRPRKRSPIGWRTPRPA
jgi:hypothetical protein